MPVRRLADMPLATGLAAVAVLVAFVMVLLAVEQQAAIAAVISIGCGALYAASRFDVGTVVNDAFRHHEPAMLTAVLLGFLAIIAWFAEDHFPLLLLATVLLYVTVAIGLNVQFGYAGIVNFAAASFFGVGAYTAMVLVRHTAVPHLLALPAGGIVAALVGVVLMLPMLRTKGHYTAVVTIAFAILFKTFLEVNDTLGGPQGLRIRGMNVFGWPLNRTHEIGHLEISHYAIYSLAALALAAAAYLLTRRLERSWVGLLMDSIRVDETAASCFGVDIARWKMLSFVWGNFLAGAAGALYALMVGFIAPNNFTFGNSLILVSIVLIGGIGNLWGAVVASAIVVILPEKFQVIQEYRFLLYAGLVILLLLYRPQGLLPRQMRSFFKPDFARVVIMTALLAARSLTRRFGGVVALNNLDLDVRKGEILGLIGPNGSGKTTFFNVVTGIFPATDGTITFDGHDITGRSPQAVYAAGISRTFQRSRLCLELSIFDNLMLGNHMRLRRGVWFNVMRRRAFQSECAAHQAAACDLLRTFDEPLAERMFDPVAALPMIQRRRIEVCRALISQPRLILLDEPSAGMTHEETRQLMDDILTARRKLTELTIIIIEHEMNVIERITDRCVVLNFGQKIAEGSYREVAADKSVQEAYLGVE